jgi:predicted amidohydrolase
MILADTFTLALHQHAPTPANIDASLSRIANALEASAEKKAHMLLVPEASLTGYNIALETARSVAVERDGPITEKLQTLCQKHNVALTYGFIERKGANLFNAAQIIDSSGQLITHYQKTHLWGELDRSLFKPGNNYSKIAEINGWKLGLLICYDIEFPENVRHYALNGCELILAPTALMTPWTFVARHVARVRAAENQLYFAYANYCGAENSIDYVGNSCIVAPDGEDLVRAEDKPALLIATLSKQSITDIRGKLPYHQDRRPELYNV